MQLNDTMLLKVSCVSHNLMQWFHGSLIEQDIATSKNHRNNNFDLVLLSSILPGSDAPEIQ